MATLKLNFINSESNLSELASMMKLLYERINTADGGVTQHSTVLYITESVGERKLLYSPVSSPGQAQHGSLCLCDSLLHPCHNQLGMVFTRTSLPYQHLTLSLSPEHLLKSDTDRAAGQTNYGDENVAWLTFEEVFAFSWSQQEI